MIGNARPRRIPPTFCTAVNPGGTGVPGVVDHDVEPPSRHAGHIGSPALDRLVLRDATRGAHCHELAAGRRGESPASVRESGVTSVRAAGRRKPLVFGTWSNFS